MQRFRVKIGDHVEDKILVESGISYGSILAPYRAGRTEFLKLNWIAWGIKNIFTLSGWKFPQCARQNIRVKMIFIQC